MNSRRLILIGGGGHCRSVIDVAESAGYVVEGILDIPENVGKSIFNYSIIGVDDQISDYVHSCCFLVTVGHVKDARVRVALHEKIHKAGGRLATIIASTAYISRYANVGEGSVVMHGAVINANATVGKGTIINTFANIEHDVCIGDYSHISTGAMINGNCKVGNRTFVGSQSVMVNGTSIGDDCVVAAGALVRKSLLIKGIYAGSPATLKIKR